MRSLACLLMVAGAALAEVEIARADRPWFLEGDYPSTRQLPLRIYFAKGKGLPGDITGFNVRAEVTQYASTGGKWEAIQRTGWAPGSLTVWVPTGLLERRGALSLKVRVRGRDSKVFRLPIKPPPSQEPVIMSVRPSELKITDGSKSVDLSIQLRHPDEWGYARVKVGRRGCPLGRVDLSSDGTGRDGSTPGSPRTCSRAVAGTG